MHLKASTLYGLTTIVAILITFSFLLELRLKPTKTMIAMFCHFLMESILLSIITVGLFMEGYGLDYPIGDGSVVRGGIYLITLLFVLYTMWEVYLKQKIGNKEMTINKDLDIEYTDD